MLDTIKGYMRKAFRYTFRDRDEWRRWGIGATSYTDSGVMMSRDTAMSVRLVWQCVNIIADDVSKTPLILYRSDNNGGKDRAKNDPLYHLLKRQPNPFTTAMDFWKSVVADALLGHGGFVFIDRDTITNQPKQLIRLLPHNVEAQVLDQTWGTLDHQYLYRTPDNTQVKLSANNIIVIKGLSYDGFTGLPLVNYAKNSFGYNLAIEKYGNTYFGNGAEPRVVLKTDKKLTPEAIENIRNQWNDIHQGLDNAHKTAILQLGLEMQQLTITPQNSQMIEARKWSPVDIAGWFKVPANRVGAEVSTSYASLEQEDLRYVTGTLDPWLYQIEQQCNSKLLRSDQYMGERYTIEYLRQSLVRADMASRYAAYAVGLAGHPFLEVNEVRGYENLPPSEIEGIQTPTNNFGDQAEPEPEPEPMTESEPEPDPEPDASARDVMRRDIERMIQRVSKDCRQNSKVGAKFYQWIEGLAVTRHKEFIAVNLTSSLAVGRSTMPAADVADRIINLITTKTSPVMDVATNDSDLFAWVGAELDEYEPQAIDDVMAFVTGG